MLTPLVFRLWLPLLTEAEEDWTATVDCSVGRVEDAAEGRERFKWSKEESENLAGLSAAAGIGSGLTACIGGGAQTLPARTY